MSKENSGDSKTSPRVKPGDREPLTGQAWWDEFEALKRDAEEQGKNYPPGYSPSCDSESIYGSDED